MCPIGSPENRHQAHFLFRFCWPHVIGANSGERRRHQCWLQMGRKAHSGQTLKWAFKGETHGSFRSKSLTTLKKNVAFFPLPGYKSSVLVLKIQVIFLQIEILWTKGSLG